MNDVLNHMAVAGMRRGLIVRLLAAGSLLQGACGGSSATPDAETSPPDDSLLDGEEVPSDGAFPESVGDSADDRWDEDVAVPATCGDGVVDPGEECDDGNRLNGDECDWACRPGPGDPAPEEPLPEIEGSDTLSLVVSTTDIDLGDLGPATFISAERQPLVWTGTHYAAVVLIEDWDDSPTTSSELQFVKFGRDSIRSGPGWRLHEPGRPFGRLDLVWNGEGFGLVWTNWADSTIWFVELDADGKPVFSAVPLIEGIAARNVSLVWNDGTYGAFWVEGTDPITEESCDAVGFVAFDRLGRPTSGRVDILPCVSPNVVQELDSASSGRADAVAFVAAEPPAVDGPDEQAFVFWAVVSAGGVLRAPASRIGPGNDHVIAIASDGESMFGLGWVSSGYDPGLHLARLDEDGLLLGPPCPVGEPVAMPPDPLSLILPSMLSMTFGGGGWGLAFPQAPGNPRCSRRAGLARTDRVGTLTDLSCLDDALEMTQAFSDVAFDGEAFGWLHNRHDGLRLIRWLVGP